MPISIAMCRAVSSSVKCVAARCQYASRRAPGVVKVVVCVLKTQIPNPNPKLKHWLNINLQAPEGERFYFNRLLTQFRLCPVTAICEVNFYSICFPQRFEWNMQKIGIIRFISIFTASDPVELLSLFSADIAHFGSLTYLHYWALCCSEAMALMPLTLGFSTIMKFHRWFLF